MTYPTDLSPAEQLRARIRLAELAEQFTAKEILRTSAWREVFERTWRHPYVPAYYPDKDTPPVLCIDGPRREEWLDAVYSDTTLITKLMPVPLSRPLRPALEMTYTSSSTLPSLVLEMLEALDVTDGHQVLEIGAGSGYNVALLCERLGSAQVTSVDIDPELVDLARERLAANGYTPTLAAIDGSTGYPPGAPYDRIIATCAVPAISAAWFEQAAPGAVILTDIHGPLGGTLARLTVDDHGTATGRFVPHWAGFMTLRHDVEPSQPPMARARFPRHEVVDHDRPPHRQHARPVRVHPPVAAARGHPRSHDRRRRPARGLSPRPGRLPRGSRHHGDRARIPVRQYGPQRLWDRVEKAATFWNEQGRPSYERFGLTATTQGQHVWYDQPDGPHHWPLPLNSPAER